AAAGAANDHEPFATIEEAQAAIDTWRKEYNADRPHQSLGMAFPAARFAPATGQALPLRVPAELDRLKPAQRTAGRTAAAEPSPAPPPASDRQLTGAPARRPDPADPP